MSSMDFPCYESLYFSNRYNPCTSRRAHLCIGEDCGQDYSIYMSFQVSSFSGLIFLKKATLILFKLTPPRKKIPSSRYYIAPLLEPFNYYHCICSPPTIDTTLQIPFCINDCQSYTEIEISPIVEAWRNDTIPNNGLLLYGSDHARLIRYASQSHEITSMHPILRMNFFENNFSPSLTCMTCIVDIEHP